MEPANKELDNSREDQSPNHGDFVDEEQASPSMSKSSKLRVKEFDYVDGEEGNEDASPGVRRGDMNDEEEMEQSLAKYEEMEEEILRFCNENNCLWEDKDFPPIMQSIYTDPSKVPEELREIQTIKWVRPKDIAKDAKVTIDGKPEGDMKQGAVGVTWFMSTLLMTSTKQQIIEKIFVNVDYFDKGFVCFQFFKNGEWKQVFIDTLLPYDPQSKQLLFAQCADPNEFWIPLIEKAYAKLHGSYEKIMTGHITDALVDLTGFTAEKYDLRDPEVRDMVENGQLWEILKSAYHQKSIIGCINSVKGKSIKNPDVGPHGILENHGYAIIEVREFPKDDNLKLVKVRNPWGPDGCWNGQFSDDSEEWDKYRHLRDELKPSFKTKKSDGTWWMSFQHLCEYLNKIYICRVFPESWQIFSIDSRWKGKTAGGSWNIMQKPADFDKYKNVQMDSDEKWFNNPQFRIRIHKETKLFVTIMQEDYTLTGHKYVPVNLMIAVNKDPRNRLWERPDEEDIILETVKTIPRNSKREIGQMVTLKKAEDKKYGYFIIVPNNETENKKEEQRPFWIRLFASEHIDVMEIPETVEKVMEGAWTDITAGGRLKTKDGRDNPHWCRNPQYFLNLDKPTHFKIILKRMNAKKAKGTKIGLCVCRYDLHENQAVKDKKGGPGRKPPIFNSAIEKLLAQTKNHLEPPVMERIERKLNIGFQEPYIESSFGSDDVAALYFFRNPTEGPFIIVPCLEEEGKTTNYKLTIYSNNPVQLTQLPESRNAVYIGKWEELSAGGCHLNEFPYEKDPSKRTWTSNPKYLLQFKEEGPVNLKVTLQVAEKNWKSKIAKLNKNTIGGMIGIYVLEKKEGKIKTEDKLAEPSFVPMLEVSETFELKTINPNGYIVMPTTYEPKLQGTFIIAVSADKDFEFIEMR